MRLEGKYLVHSLYLSLKYPEEFYVVTERPPWQRWIRWWGRDLFEDEHLAGKGVLTGFVSYAVACPAMDRVTMEVRSSSLDHVPLALGVVTPDYPRYYVLDLEDRHIMADEQVEVLKQHHALIMEALAMLGPYVSVTATATAPENTADGYRALEIEQVSVTTLQRLWRAGAWSEYIAAKLRGEYDQET